MTSVFNQILLLHGIIIVMIGVISIGTISHKENEDREDINEEKDNPCRQDDDQDVKFSDFTKRMVKRKHSGCLPNWVFVLLSLKLPTRDQCPISSYFSEISPPIERR